jgi:hypothetical protein
MVSCRIYGSHVSRGCEPGVPYIHRLTDEYRVPRVSPRAAAPHPVASYMHRCRIIDKYILNSSVPMNILDYVHQCIRQLTDKFMVYSSV